MRTEDKSKTDITKTKHNPEKQTTQNTAKQNYPGSVASYDTRPENGVGLFCNAPEPTQRGFISLISNVNSLYTCVGYLINEQESCAIAKMTARCALYK